MEPLRPILNLNGYCMWSQVVPNDKITLGSTLPGDLEIISIDAGEKRTINSIITESPYTLLILQRNYAWPPCNNHTQAVSDTSSEFKQLGCKVVLLTNGTRDDGLVWRKRHPSQFPAYYDPNWTVYRKLGLRRILKILTTEAMCGYGERRIQGIPFPESIYEGDDLWIMGGDFIVRKDGKIVYALHQTTYYERPSVEDLLSCLKAQPTANV